MLEKESASSRYHVCQFLVKTNNLQFFGLNLPKYGFWGLNFKNLSPDSELVPPRYHLCQFSFKMDNSEFFSYFECFNYMRYFASNNVEDVAESWVDVGISWVHSLVVVLLKFCCRAIISWIFIICFRILWFHLNLMISSKDISASQRLKCSLDIFFMLGILLRNSSTLKKVLEPFSPSSSCLMLAQSLAPFPCLFSYR